MPGMPYVGGPDSLQLADLIWGHAHMQGRRRRAQAARIPARGQAVSGSARYGGELGRIACQSLLHGAQTVRLPRELTRELEQYDPSSEFTLGGDEEGWTATHSDPNHPQAGAAADDIPDMDDGGDKKEDEDDIPDIGELELHADDDEAALSAATTSRDKKYMTAAEPEDTVLRTRTYDLYMTYDQYYQCPRFWLVGYDESRHPLAPDQVMDDVSEEHARKTITVDPHPNLSLVAASIHPCKHAEVMKKLVDNIVEGGGSFQVEHYLLLFLKFISSVVPTIQYDYTMSIGQ
eukprot:355265-Chlamydomonas_euryale.AAC.19